MTKRIVALIIAAIIPISLLGGCSKGKPLTIQEYYTESKRCWTEFISATRDWSKLAFETDPKSEDMHSIIARRKKALDDFAAINPPEKYKTQQENIVKSLEYEYKWNDAALKVADAKNDEDIEKAGDEISSILSSIPDGQSLPLLYFDLSMEFENDPEITTNNTTE